MSAFLVADATIHKAVSFLADDRDGDHIRRHISEKLGIDISTNSGRAALGNLMLSLNREALAVRYGDNEPATCYEFRPVPVTRLQAFKSLQCWHYQCCEGNIPEESQLYQVMAEVSGRMAEMIVSRLAEYDRAEWG